MFFTCSSLERSLCTGHSTSSYSSLFLRIWCTFGVRKGGRGRGREREREGEGEGEYPSLLLVGPNSLEPFSEWAWSCFSGILFGVQHHYIMQPIALVRSKGNEVWGSPKNEDAGQGVDSPEHTQNTRCEG